MRQDKQHLRLCILIAIGILGGGLHCRTDRSQKQVSPDKAAAVVASEQAPHVGDNELKIRFQRLLANKAEKRRQPLGVEKHNRELKPSKVVLIVVDTERADSLQPYGATLPTTPFLSALAKEGITFKTAFSPSSWTAPAMFSIMTGLYPSEHGGTPSD